MKLPGRTPGALLDSGRRLSPATLLVCAAPAATYSCILHTGQADAALRRSAQAGGLVYLFDQGLNSEYKLVPLDFAPNLQDALKLAQGLGETCRDQERGP